MKEPELSETVYVQPAGWEQLPLIETAQRFGATVVAVDSDPSAAGREVADTFVEIDNLRDASECLEVAKDHDIDAVATDQCDFSLFTTVYIAARLDLQSASLTAAQNTTNKKRMRRAVGDEATQPAYRICGTAEEIRTAATEIGLPVIVKPVDSRGAFGVRRLTDLDQVHEAYLDGIANSDARELIVEDFIGGIPVTVDGYYTEQHRSLATASKDTPLGNLDPDRELTYPAQISDQKRNEITTLTDSLAEALGVSYGPTHAEYIMTDDGTFYLLEFHNRGGGLQTSASLVPALTGFDVSTQLIFDAVGVQSGQETEPFPLTRAGIIRPIQFESGTISAIGNVDELRGRDDVLVLQLFAEPGDTIGEFNLATEAHAALVTVGDTVDEAVELADSVENSLTVTYE